VMERGGTAQDATPDSPGGYARTESVQFLRFRGMVRGNRKDLSDLVYSCTVERNAFIKRLRLTAGYPHRLLVVTSTLSQVKSPYSQTNVDPNRTTQFLVAALAGLQVPFICSETHALGEELVGSYLYQVHLYHWLESNDDGRISRGQ
jgi:hypothetical protein